MSLKSFPKLQVFGESIVHSVISIFARTTVRYPTNEKFGCEVYN